MKTALYTSLMFVGIIVCVLAACFLLITNLGGKSFKKYDGGVLIQKPPEVVFDIMTDYQKMALWNEGLAEAVGRDGGAMKLGSRFVEIYGKGKDQTTLDLSVTSFVPGRQVVYQVTSTDLQGTQTFKLERINNYTRVNFSGEMQYKTVPNLFSPLSILQIQKNLETNLKKLKILAEAS